MDTETENQAGMVRLGDAAEQAGITPQQLQYYCMVGLVRPTALSPGGQRLFDRRAIQRITMIRLLNASGYTLRAIREIFVDGPSGRSRTRCRTDQPGQRK